MNRFDSHVRWLAVTSAFVVFLVGSTWWLGAAQVPSPANNSTISWSVASVSVSVFPGTASTTKVSFRSNQPLTNVIVKITPSLNDLVTAYPNSFSSLKANQDYQITLTLNPPREFINRNFGGVIEIADSGTPRKVYAQPLNMALHAEFSEFSNATFGIGNLSYPINWFWLADETGVAFSNVQNRSELSDQTLQTEAKFDIKVLKNSNPQMLSIDQWFDAHFAGGVASDLLNRRLVTVAGRLAVQIEISEIGRRVHVYVSHDTDVIEMVYGLFAPSFTSTYESVVRSIQF